MKGMGTLGLKRRGRIAALTLGLALGPACALGVLHPYFTVKSVLPAGMNDIPGIGGLDLLPNGDGAVCTWGGSQKSAGEVWIVPGLAGGAPGTPVRIATGLREALGLKTLGNDFYVLEKSRILKFTGSGTAWTRSVFWTLPTAWYNDAQWHHFSFNLVSRDNAFWFTTGTAYDYDPKDPVQRGGLIKVPLNGGAFSQFARGLRNPDGLGLGPDDEFFVPENQGHWKPADALYHLPIANIPTNGRFFGFRTEGNNACGTTPPSATAASCPADPEYPPAVWIPYGGFSHSPTRPILLKAGPYAGQMISGDVFHGGTLRYFLEKVNGEYQGAVFAMMTAGAGGIQFGIHQFLATPSGSLLVAGIGGGTCGLGGSGNWNWNGTCRGLDLLTPTGKAPFEPLAIRSVPGGFDVEFTQPANAAAGLKANWQVRTTVFTPAQAYGVDGGGSDNNITVEVASAVLSPDGRSVRLQLAGLATRCMYAITMNNVTSATGEQPYTNVGYYTLNAVGPATALGSVRAPANAPVRPPIFGTQAGRVTVELPYRSFRAGMYSVDGTRVAQASGTGPGRMQSGRLSPGVYLLSGLAERAAFRHLFRVE